MQDSMKADAESRPAKVREKCRRFATLGAVMCFSCGCVSSTLVHSNFGSDSQSRGWASLPSWRDPGAYTIGEDAAALGGRYVIVEKGIWRSPAFAIDPFEYYRLRFRVQTPEQAMWSVAYLTTSAGELSADHYTDIAPSDEWSLQTSFFKGKPGAQTADVRFHPADGGPLSLDSVTVDRADRAEVTSWADDLYRTLQPVTTTWPSDAGAHIGKSLEKLRRGETLRIVLLGDSIANDLGNSTFDVLVERLYPGSRIEVVTAIEGATGCWHYRHENRVESYVFAYDPDLVIIAGISHRWDYEAIADVVDQIRAGCDADVMIMTGAAAPMRREVSYAAKQFRISTDEAVARIAHFKAELEKVAHEKKAEWFHMRAAWDAYVAASGQAPEYFLRDGLHANDGGRQVMARIVESYFTAIRQ